VPRSRKSVENHGLWTHNSNWEATQRRTGPRTWQSTAFRIRRVPILYMMSALWLLAHNLHYCSIKSYDNIVCYSIFGVINYRATNNKSVRAVDAKGALFVWSWLE
jgi:hypothetical protein